MEPMERSLKSSRLLSVYRAIWFGDACIEASIKPLSSGQ